MSEYRKNFNPRSREGSDLFAVLTAILPLGFQSTLPRRERRSLSTIPRKRLNFNPRSREGSDLKGATENLWLSNFNPRSREGSDGQLRGQVHRR